MDGTLYNAPCGYLSFDDHGKIIEVNDTFCSQLGYHVEELKETKIDSLLTIASQIFLQTHLFPMLALNGKAEEIFVTLRARSKAELPMLVYAKRLASKNECILVPVPQRQKYEEEILRAKRAAEEALRDNRELTVAKNELQKHAQELDHRILQLEQRNRELSQVTNILFHDLHEPTRKIETFSELLIEEASLEEPAKDIVARIATAARRSSLLLRALQAFVSVDSPGEKLELVDLNALLKSVYAHVSHGSYPNVSSTIEVEALPQVPGFPGQLRLLFGQLLDNSFRFRNPRQPLHVRVSGSIIQENTFKRLTSHYLYVNFLQIFFMDNGKGIPEPCWQHVFELLQKLDVNNAQPGCGLAISRKILENHHGSIEIVGTNCPGTTFRILLPLQQERTI